MSCLRLNSFFCKLFRLCFLRFFAHDDAASTIVLFIYSNHERKYANCLCFVANFCIVIEVKPLFITLTFVWWRETASYIYIQQQFYCVCFVMTASVKMRLINAAGVILIVFYWFIEKLLLSQLWFFFVQTFWWMLEKKNWLSISVKCC